MTAFEILRQEFLDWCLREQQSLQRQHEVFANGTCSMHCNGRDIATEVLSNIAGYIGELERLISKCESRPA